MHRISLFTDLSLYRLVLYKDLDDDHDNDCVYQRDM